MVITAFSNSFNNAIVAAVTVFADLSLTRVDTVKLVFRSIIVTRAYKQDNQAWAEKTRVFLVELNQEVDKAEGWRVTHW